MAKVKIQGNASGTGVLTVTAPNTSTDRTITLPDSTGTLATTADVPSSITDNGDATAITINSSEQVGIGVTSPDTTLHIKGTNQIAKFETTSATGQNYIRFTGSSGNKGYFGYGGGSNDLLSLFNQENYDMAFGTNDTERMRILAGGGLTFNGDTAAANALDDYEEGTWSPVLGGTSASGTISGGSATGLYTKIGNMCYFQFRIEQQTLSGASGSIRITGLPFTAATTGNAYPSHAWGMTMNIDFDNSRNQAWYHDGTTLYTLESRSGLAWVDRPVTNSSSIYMNQCGAYRVA